ADLYIGSRRDLRDLLYNYPAIYFPSDGFEIVATEDADWTVGAKVIKGTQFTFEPSKFSNGKNLHVAYFAVAPDGEIVRSTKEMYQVLGSMPTEKRARGAAEFRVVIAGDCPPEVMKQVVVELIGGALPVINVVSEH